MGRDTGREIGFPGFWGTAPAPVLVLVLVLTPAPAPALALTLALKYVGNYQLL